MARIFRLRSEVNVGFFKSKYGKFKLGQIGLIIVAHFYMSVFLNPHYYSVEFYYPRAMIATFFTYNYAAHMVLIGMNLAFYVNTDVSIGLEFLAVLPSVYKFSNLIQSLDFYDVKYYNMRTWSQHGIFPFAILLWNIATLIFLKAVYTRLHGRTAVPGFQLQEPIERNTAPRMEDLFVEHE